MTKTVSVAKVMQIDRARQTATEELPRPEIVEAEGGTSVPWQALKNGLHLRIPRFDGMVVGDDLRMILSNGPESFGKVIYLENTDRDVIIPMTAVDAVRFQGSDATLQYLANLQPSPISIYGMGAPALPPVVEEAVDGTLPSEVASAGVTVRIRPYEGMATGDMLSIFLFGTAPDGCYVKHIRVESQDVGSDLTFSIDGRYTKVHKHGNLWVAYAVTTPRVKLVAPHVRLAVRGDVTRPVADHGVGDGSFWPAVLPLTDESGKVPMHLPPYEDMAVGDLARCFILAPSPAGGREMLCHSIAADMVGRIVRFLVPLPVITANKGDVIEIACIVERASGIAVSSPVLAVQIPGDER